MLGVGRGNVDPLRKVCADGHEHCIEGALAALRLEVLDLMVAREADSQRPDPIDLCAHHVPWQAIGGNPVAHHPAGLWARIANLDLVPQTRQMVGR